MKEYDIFLKQRIHESKLFIYSIPYRCYTTGLETAMSIVAQITDTELHYSLGDVNSAMVISTSESGGAARKFISVADQIEIFCQMAAAIISHFEVGQGIAVQSSVNAGLRRYRLLKELDDLNLEDIDDMTLEDLNYVELT